MFDKACFVSPTVLAKSFLFFLVHTGIFNARRADGLFLLSTSQEKFSNQTLLADDWIPLSFPTAKASDISQQCASHTQDYVRALQGRRPWAIQMYGSSGKLITNLIHVDNNKIYHESGLFDECLAIKSPEMPFRGQYCTVFFDLKPVSSKENETDDKEGEPYESMSNFLLPSAGFCLPSTCTARDLRSAVAQWIGYRTINGINHTVVTITNEDFCYTEEKVEDRNKQSDFLVTATLIISGQIGLLVLTATVHEFWRECYLHRPVDSKREGSIIRWLHCFSALSNCRNMVSTQDEGDDSLSCLYGLRVLSTCLVVLQHVFIEIVGRSSYNKEKILKVTMREEFRIANNPTIAVDNFFLMSGLLVAYSQLRKLDRNQGAFNLRTFYLHRYFRLTPLYMTAMAFAAALYPYIGTGPDWNYIELVSKSSRKYWWTTLLYIQNYYVPRRENDLLTNPSTSIAETWYLACDMQMFWISPLFIYPLWRWKRVGFIWTTLALFAFLAASVAVYVTNDIPPSILPTRPTDLAKFDEYARLYYLRTYARIPPYLIGILLGWLLHRTKAPSFRLKSYQIAAGWLTASLISCAVLFGLVPYLDETEVPVIPDFVRVTYGALHRSTWALAVGWLIFACTHGYGGYLNKFFSWKVFMPLSRLSYAVYLVHPIYIKAYYSYMRKPLHSTEISFITTYSGILTMTFLIASVVSVGIEMPFNKLDKLLIVENTDSKKVL